MRCPYCNTLIIHKFNGNYNRMDRKRKARHMRHCDERPDDEPPSYRSVEPGTDHPGPEEGDR